MMSQGSVSQRSVRGKFTALEHQQQKEEKQRDSKQNGNASFNGQEHIIEIFDDDQDLNKRQKRRNNGYQDPFDHRQNLPSLSLKNVHKTYLLGLQGVPALRGVNIQVKKGEMLCILGTSGGGKTTLLNLVGTIDTPTKGDIYIQGNRIKSSTKDSLLSALRLKEIGFVFQSFNLLPSLTAFQNVCLPMQLRGVLSRSKVIQRAKNLLSSVDLSHRMSHFPNQLSGGQQQRVTIARSMANEPSILLMDQPTGDLDTKNSDIVIKILIDLNRKNNLSMVMVTHDVANKYYSHRVVRVSDGKIIAEQNIDPQLRMEQIKNLNERIEGFQKGQNIGNRLEIREGVQAINSSPLNKKNDSNANKVQNENVSTPPGGTGGQKNRVQGSRTTHRKPTDYPILRRMLERKEMRDNIEE